MLFHEPLQHIRGQALHPGTSRTLHALRTRQDIVNGLLYGVRNRLKQAIDPFSIDDIDGIDHRRSEAIDRSIFGYMRGRGECEEYVT